MPRTLLIPLYLILTAAGVFLIAGAEAPAVFHTLAFALITAPLLIAALVLGLLLTKPFVPLFTPSPWPDALRALTALALGTGALSFATLVLGSLHLLSFHNHPFPPTLLLPLAILLGFPATRAYFRSLNLAPLRAPARPGDFLLLLAALPTAVLLIAATFPPGTLWATEGNGYDVLEYHLQLPREYALLNSTSPLAHNIYSFFPANTEMLYLLLTQLAKTIMSDPSHLWAAFPAQLLHAFLMLATAATLPLLPLPFRLSSTARAAAILLFLGIPWTLITGSLAYNEAGMLLPAALALAFTLQPTAHPRHAGLLAGLLLGLSLGSKLTAGLFFALPVAALLLAHAFKSKHHLATLALAILISAVTYAPWALRAAVASHGNPIFPFATTLLGGSNLNHPWTPAQSARFIQAHAAPPSQTSLSARRNALISSSLLDPQWSPSLHSLDLWTASAAAPDASPLKRLGILWVTLPLVLLLALLPTATRTTSLLLILVLTLQLLAWLFFTHLQARFLLPTAIPLALLVASALRSAPSDTLLLRTLRLLAVTAITLHTLATAFLLLPEDRARLLFGPRPHPNAPAGSPIPTPPIGELFSMEFNAAALAKAASLPPNTEFEPPPPEPLLLVGAATPWSYADPVFYTTVFNQELNPLSLALTTQNPLATLQQQNIHFLLIHWSEIDRLTRTYGFDPAITPALLTQIKSAGAHEIPLPSPAATLLKLPN